MTRCYVINIVDGSYMDQYPRMYDCCHELLRLNRGLNVKLSTKLFQVDEGDLEDREGPLCPHFQRVYICFIRCEESFKHCRPIIGLDGCFLKDAMVDNY